MSCDSCRKMEAIDHEPLRCAPGEAGCWLPALDADGARAVGIRNRLMVLPPNVSGEWLLDRLGASLWDVEMIGVIEQAIREGSA